MTENLITAPTKYSPYPGNADLVYDAICKVLSERKDQVEWSTFTRDEWQMLVMMAKSEGVGPLLYWFLGKLGNWELGPSATEQEAESPYGSAAQAQGLRNLGKDYPVALKVPKAVGQALHANYYQTAANNAVLFQELERILVAFEEAGIPVIVLKGAALAQTLYPDPGLRPMGDLDFLVRVIDTHPAVALLEEMGYTRFREMAPWIGDSVYHHANMRREIDPDISVEIHWNLISGAADWRSPKMDWFWEQTIPWKHVTEPPGIFTISLEAHLLYLAAHSMLQHGVAEARVCWLYDLHLMISTHANVMDWESLQIKAAELRWAAALYTSIEICQRCFGTTVSDDFISQLAVGRTVDEIKLVKSMADGQRRRTIMFSEQFFALNWWGRILLTFAFLFPAPEYMLHRYKPSHKWLFFLFYPYRWFDTLRDAISTLFFP